MKVALIQMNAGEDKGENIRKAEEMVREAADRKAEWILLPEVFPFRRRQLTNQAVAAVTERVPGEATRPFMRLASRRKVFILAGSVYERSPDPARAYNTSVLMDPRGRVIAKYRKIHLFDARLGSGAIRESRRLRPGRCLAAARVGPFLAGLTVCYDLRFPEIYRAYARRGCTVLTAPSSFTRTTGRAHWEVLLRARAVENLAYVLAPNQVGRSCGRPSYGNSMIVDPWGRIVARGSPDREEIVYGTIRPQRVAEARRKLPGIGRTSGPKK